MEKPVDPWLEISRLIGKEKEKALTEFRSREFVVPAEPKARPARRPARPLVLQPFFLAVAASILLVAGLISFWLLRGSWESVAQAPAWNEILADSIFYGGENRPDTGSIATDSARPSAPFFTAWASGLKCEQDTEPADRSAPVQNADPDDVRRNIGRAIREGAFEQILSHFREFHDKEA